MQLVENLWYPILESKEVPARKPFATERLGQKLVLWRDAGGQLHCHRDFCPHLGAALSLGHIAGDRLVCPFHGFEFDPQGECQLIPANGIAGKIPPGMCLKTYPVREAHGLIWLWWGQNLEQLPELPFFDDLDSHWQYKTITADWPAHYTRAIENQLDVAHLAFVHRTTIGAGGRSFVEGPYVEASDQELKVWVFNRRDDGQAGRSQKELAQLAEGKDPSLHLKYPGIWKLSISPTVKNFIAFVPINENQTRYYLRSYFKTPNRFFGLLMNHLMSLSNPFILNQDRRVVLSQTPVNSLDATEEHLIGADRAISQYRRWLRHRLGYGTETSLPMVQNSGLNLEN